MNNGQTEMRMNEIKSDLESLNLNLQILINSLCNVYEKTNDKDLSKIIPNLEKCLSQIKESEKDIKSSFELLI